MALLKTNNTFRRLRNRYRLVIMNDDTFEELATLRLNRLTVYIAMSAIFVVLVGLTIALLSFTNLKYIIPGYGKQSSVRELRMLKIKTDSLETTIGINQQYLQSLKKVLSGDTTGIKLDTSLLLVPAADSDIKD